MTQSLDSFKSRSNLSVGGKNSVYFSLVEAEKNGLQGISRLPHAMKVVLENLLRFEDGGFSVSLDDIRHVAPPVLRHRVLVNFQAEADGVDAESLVRRLIDAVPVAV